MNSPTLPIKVRVRQKDGTVLVQRVPADVRVDKRNRPGHPRNHA